MAVTKLWKVSVRLGQVLDYTTNPEKTANPEYSPEDYQALKDVLAYAKDEEKTEHEFFCDGINCNVDMARDQFITVKEQFDKLGGIQAYHGYLSFKENEVTPEQAQQIGIEFATKMWGKRFQVVVTTHLNRALRGQPENCPRFALALWNGNRDLSVNTKKLPKA